MGGRNGADLFGLYPGQQAQRHALHRRDGNIAQRVHLHKTGQGGAFTKKYGVHQLVHLETFAAVHDAIAREKAIKKWRRAWKLQLIERDNPGWRDLSSEMMA